jgi:hypothetical protein
MMIHRRLYPSCSRITGLEFPGVPPLIMDQPGIIIPLVEILENR